MIFGPNMQNFKAVAGAFLAEQAVLQVQDAAGLEQGIAALLADDQRRLEMGARALEVVKRNLGATDRTVRLIIERLQG
jgi:3-deoxy-D-manno-octulosonic-acid transferase